MYMLPSNEDISQKNKSKKDVFMTHFSVISEIYDDTDNDLVWRF